MRIRITLNTDTFYTVLVCGIIPFWQAINYSKVYIVYYSKIIRKIPRFYFFLNCAFTQNLYTSKLGEISAF